LTSLHHIEPRLKKEFSYTSNPRLAFMVCYREKFTPLLGAFGKLGKATFSFAMSVRVEQHVSHWRELMN